MNNYSDQNRPPLFRNHSFYKRQIRLYDDLSVCEVFSIRRATKADDPHYQTTYQDPSVGRYIVLKNSTPVGQGIRIYDLQKHLLDNGGRLLNPEETQKIVDKLPPVIVEWLMDVSSPKQKHSNYIPVGYGWDGKFTLSEYNKRQTTGMLFSPRKGMSTNIDPKWLDDVLDEICRTPKNLLNLRWMSAYPFPKDRYLKLTNSIQQKHYIFIYKDGSVELQKNKRVIGDVTQYPGINIPNTVDRVIVLTHGVTCRDDGQPAGIGVELYKDD